MRIGNAAGEPWFRSDNLNELADAPAISALPMRTAIAIDRQTVRLSDSVDYIHHRTLTRTDVLQLAREFEQLASLMHEEDKNAS